MGGLAGLILCLGIPATIHGRGRRLRGRLASKRGLGFIVGRSNRTTCQAQPDVLVRIPGTETAPTPATGEIIIFDEHFYRGFGLPASSFFSEWLHFFGLQPHHLALNAILQLSAFMVLCEGFLGIEPRLDLWRSLFFFKQQSIAMDKAAMEKHVGPRAMTPCGAALVHHHSKSGFPSCRCRSPSSSDRRASST
ncbi:retrotransposon protein [Hordeum vulgare]|nr:retrotransposon protein [Hordeum vulgare]